METKSGGMRNNFYNGYVFYTCWRMKAAAMDEFAVFSQHQVSAKTQTSTYIPWWRGGGAELEGLANHLGIRHFVIIGQLPQVD